LGKESEGCVMLDFKGLKRGEVRAYFLANASAEELQTAISHSRKTLEILGEVESFTARATLLTLQQYEERLKELAR
jgi:hypothetical protein